MEAESKRMPEKDSVTFMDDGETHLINELEICDGTYRWEELYKSVLGEKYDVIFLEKQMKEECHSYTACWN